MTFSNKQKNAGPGNKQVVLSEDIRQKAFDNSLQANIVFRVADGHIIQVNKAACQLLGYSKKLLLTKNRKDLFIITEEAYKSLLKQRKEKGGRGDMSLIKKSGKTIQCEVNSVVFKDANGIDNSILCIVDLTERLLKQETIDVENEKATADNIAAIQSRSDTQQAGENINWIKSITRTSYDVIWDWNMSTKMISFGLNYENIFGNKLPKNSLTYKEWMNSFNSKDRKSIRGKIDKIFESKKDFWEDRFSFICNGGMAGEVTCRANILRDIEGKITRIIGVIHDVSKIKTLEASLLRAINQKERQIVDAIVESKEIERINIGNELHDNITQLLGASMLYLDMARKDCANGEIYLIHSSEYTLAAINEIRKLSKGLSSTTISDFGLCGALEQMTSNIMQASSIKIHYTPDYSVEQNLNEIFTLNIYRILQEQLNNIIKHAKAPNVYIELSRSETELRVSIADDGVGCDLSKKKDGIGMGNIISRAEIYKGAAVFASEPKKGCTLEISFPITELCLE